MKKGEVSGDWGQMNPKLLPSLISIKITKYSSSITVPMTMTIYIVPKSQKFEGTLQKWENFIKNKGVKYVQKIGKGEN